MKKWIGLLALLMLSLVCATALGETNTQVKHYLMLGEDGYAEHVTDDARTDTIVLVSLDTKYNRVILTSILRDSKINNPRGNETKINLLYKNHGFSGIISCLERELDIQIEGAILVNFENVKPVIDALGGVDIEIDQNEYLAIRSILLGKDPNMPDGPGLVHMTGRITKLFDFKANGREPIESAQAGDIVAFAGLPDISIGNTICDPSKVQPLPFVKINDPTVEMTFSVNDSPFAGKEGKYVTSRQIRDRLMRELLKDVALKVEDSATNDSFRVMGRGEMHLSILIETMRREGYELQVSPPHVLTHEENGKVMEPMERVVVDVPETYQGNVMTALGARKAILMNMQMMNSRSRIEFRMPSRGLFGYRSQFLTDTHGEGIMNTIFDGYEEWCGDIQTRSTGSLISFDTGDAVTYGLFNAQQRGTLIVNAGEKVYAGEVVGYTPTGEDITVNVCKTKHLTNTRASGSDDALRLVPVSKFSLEGCLEFLAPDELLEVTPENLRIRKRILDHDLRMKAASKKNK
mgnify:CR=1 FL=1